MGKSNAKYRVSGARADIVTSDANGVLILSTPHDTTTQSLEIAPL